MQAVLLFAYNADSGLFNTVADVAHKVFSPDTYACNLCAVTHGALGMRAEWKEFLESLDRPMEFFHRDELRARWPESGAELPAVFLRRGDDLEVLLSAETIGRVPDLEALKRTLRARLAGG